ncbi:hypothetical protein HPB50_015204 [Hyalomma asiaticum]|uniref:Uncharacterized protein n=1 Tax=Hyalomma asiaticum TaxID=266040 RepID=A0ACB7SR71_HYAAI|nr:hypothetical protein HPB50_015204 [Hyalomma asiaticum]
MIFRDGANVGPNLSYAVRDSNVEAPWLKAIRFSLGPYASTGIKDNLDWEARAMIIARTCSEQVRLPPEVNRILYVRNLPYKISGEEMYDIFGKYGAIRQIRVGNTPETRGTAFVVYEDIFDAKNACDHLSGFNVCNRYLVVLYYQPTKAFKRVDQDKKKEEIDRVKKKYGVSDD